MVLGGIGAGRRCLVTFNQKSSGFSSAYHEHRAALGDLGASLYHAGPVQREDPGMCGRYVLKAALPEIARMLGMDVDLVLEPS